MSNLKKAVSHDIRRWSGSFILCAAVAWLCSVPFVECLEIQLLLALPCGLLLSSSLRNWLKRRKKLFVLEQFRRLLEHLLARMTAGATLEKAFIDAPACLVQLLGKKSALMSSLKNLEKQLSAHQPLDRLHQKLFSSLPCQEASVFLKILPGLRQSGGDISQYIRQQLRMAAEKIALQHDMSAETTQRKTEALILAAMPFILAFFLQKSSILYIDGQGTNAFAVIGMIIAYSLAMAAGALTLSSIGFDADLTSAGQSIPGMPRLFGRHFQLPGKAMQIVYQRLLPESYGVRLTQILHENAASSDQKELVPLQSYFERKAVFCMIGFIMGILLITILPEQIYWILILPVSLNVLQDFQIFSLARSKQWQYRLEYPAFINLVTALLEAGLSLHTAMVVCIDSIQPDYADSHQKQVPSILNKDLIEINRQLQLGLPINLIIEKISSSCPVPEIQAALVFLVRYDRMGGQEILDLLQMQSAACWNLFRQAIRKQMEQQALRLLLPMMLDLISVIVTAVLPAWISLRSF